MTPNAHLHFGVAGRFSFHVTKADKDGNPVAGTTRKVAECENLITDTGMDSFAASTGTYWDYVGVGSGTATPQNSDTVLQNQVAITNILSNPGDPVGNSYGYRRQVVNSPRWWSLWKQWRFAAGAAAGNLSEVAVLRGSPSPRYAFCRALITDSNGDPVTITILSDEILDVRYELFFLIPESDVTGSVTLKGTAYNFTMRPCSIGRTGDSNDTGWPMENINSMALNGPRAVGIKSANSSSTIAAVVAATALLPMDQHPITSSSAPNNRSSDSGSVGTYVGGQYYLDSKFNWSLGAGNHAAISLITLNCGLGAFQIHFDGGTFSKSSSEKMEFTLRTTWARATPP